MLSNLQRTSIIVDLSSNFCDYSNMLKLSIVAINDLEIYLKVW